MDALPLVLGILLVTVLGSLASLVGADSRDGFDGDTIPGAHVGPTAAL